VPGGVQSAGLPLFWAPRPSLIPPFGTARGIDTLGDLLANEGGEEYEDLSRNNLGLATYRAGRKARNLQHLPFIQKLSKNLNRARAWQACPNRV